MRFLFLFILGTLLISSCGNKINPSDPSAMIIGEWETYEVLLQGKKVDIKKDRDYINLILITKDQITFERAESSRYPFKYTLEENILKVYSKTLQEFNIDKITKEELVMSIIRKRRGLMTYKLKRSKNPER